MAVAMACAEEIFFQDTNQCRLNVGNPNPKHKRVSGFVRLPAIIQPMECRNTHLRLVCLHCGQSDWYETLLRQQAGYHHCNCFSNLQCLRSVFLSSSYCALEADKSSSSSICSFLQVLLQLLSRCTIASFQIVYKIQLFQVPTGITWALSGLRMGKKLFQKILFACFRAQTYRVWKNIQTLWLNTR